MATEKVEQKRLPTKMAGVNAAGSAAKPSKTSTEKVAASLRETAAENIWLRKHRAKMAQNPKLQKMAAKVAGGCVATRIFTFLPAVLGLPIVQIHPKIFQEALKYWILIPCHVCPTHK